MHAGQERAGGAGVVARPLARQRVAVLVGEPAQDRQPVAERLERLHDRLHPEAAPRRVGRPLVHHDAVRHVDDAQPPDRGRGRGAERREGRHHAVEERQGQRGADAAQERPAGQMGLRDDHCSRAFLIWNGGLSTMPTMREDQR